MPPTWKKLRGHIGLGLSVLACVVGKLCIRSRTVRDRILKFVMCNIVLPQSLNKLLSFRDGPTDGTSFVNIYQNVSLV